MHNSQLLSKPNFRSSPSRFCAAVFLPCCLSAPSCSAVTVVHANSPSMHFLLLAMIMVADLSTLIPAAGMAKGSAFLELPPLLLAILKSRRGGVRRNIGRKDAFGNEARMVNLAGE